MARVVVIGSLNHDVVVRAPRHPTPGETLLGTGVAAFPGGKGANQAVASARAGASTLMIGRVGPDDAGRVRTDALRADHVDVSNVGICRHDPTGTALITVADSGENTIIVVPGANAKLRPVHVDDAVAAGAFDVAGVVLAQLECPIDTVTHAFRLAHERGIRTVLNAAPAQSLPAELVAVVDVLIVNEHELGLVTGMDVSDAASIEAAAMAAQQLVATVIVTLGDAGAWAATAEGISRVGGHRVEAVDTTAAGDAFCGVLCASLSATGEIDALSLSRALPRANAAGALAVTKAGAQPSLPTDAQISAFLAMTASP